MAFEIYNKNRFCMSEKRSLDKTSELYNILPFMESFPFTEYKITLEEDDSEPDVAPMLLKALGTLGTQCSLTFYYTENDAEIQIVFDRDDIFDIEDISHKIKILNSVRECLDGSLQSDLIKDKIVAIKKSRKFIDLLELSNLSDSPFIEVLQDMCEIYNITFSTSHLLAIQKLSFTQLRESQLTLKQREILKSFLNFKLHYAKIILGIVIAAKIY